MLIALFAALQTEKYRRDVREHVHLKHWKGSFHSVEGVSRGLLLQNKEQRSSTRHGFWSERSLERRDVLRAR